MRKKRITEFFIIDILIFTDKIKRHFSDANFEFEEFKKT